MGSRTSMMKNIHRCSIPGLILWSLMLIPLSACGQQAANTSQQLVFAGLRSVAQQGQIDGVRCDTAGNLYLLLNQGDGVRLLKTDNAASTVLAQASIGTAGDVGVALALDRAGNVYVTGTTNSGTLMGTPGAAIPNRTDSSTNSFVAKFDSNLSPLFVTFTGGSRIAAAAISATSDAVFVTGITYAANLPVTGNGIQQAPAYESTQSGFVEKFSSDGATLLYATYLSGAAGSTTPTAIVADAADDAYIAGETTAPGFPTVAALVPAMLGNPSGFLTRLTPAGDGIAWSTFVPGAGLTSIALDSTGQLLLVSGAVALGQFPVDTVTVPLAPATYQVLLRIPAAGNAVLSSTLLAPGTQSYVAAAANGAAWVDGNLTAPLLPMTTLAAMGNGFAVHVPAGATIDQTARFGGLPNGNASYASLPANLTSVAVDPGGEALIAGAVLPTASSAELGTETYDLPLLNAPTAAFPSGVSDAEVTASTCSGSLCAGSAAYLSVLNPNVSGAVLALSANDLPFVVLRNLGSGEADGLQLSATGSTPTTNCPAKLYAGGECNILLAGGGAGTLTATASNATTQTVGFPAYAAASTTIAFYPKELDFGIQSSVSGAATRTITVTNLGTASQTFVSALDATATREQEASPFSEAGSDCTLAGSTTMKVLAAGGTCHITIGFNAFANASNDGFQTADWLVGGKDVLLTGYSQAAALSVSASEIDFGTKYTNGVRLPRYLYLSNVSNEAIAHAALTLPAGSPFTLIDGCPTLLEAESVCRVRIDYLAAKSTSIDSVTLALDQGLSVLITGETLPPQTVSGQTVNPNLSVTPGEIAFVNAVPVTGVSGAPEAVTVTNNGTAAFPLALTLTGDFTDSTSCGVTLGGGQSCNVELTFAPSGPGARQGLLAVTAGSGTTPEYISLTGIASAILPANNGAIDLGSVEVGQPATQFLLVPQPITPLNATTTGPFSVVLVANAGFGAGNPAAPAYGATVSGGCPNCYLGIRFLPAATGLQTGTLTIASVAGGSPYVLQLTGTGLPLSGLLLTPAAENFGSVPINSISGTQLFTLTNLTATGAAVTLSSPATSGDFTIVNAATGGAACGGTLAYTASCFVSVAFAPTAAGTRSGRLTLTGGGSTATAALSGIGTADPGIAINPLTVTFNNVPGTTAAEQTVSVTNTGSGPVLVGNVSVGTNQFISSSHCTTLPVGGNCSITVTYVPGPATAMDVLTIPVTNTVGAPVTTSYSVALNGAYTGPSAGLEMVPGAVQFGPSAVGQQATARQFTIDNLTAKSLTLDIAIPRQFVLTSAPCEVLAPGASCNFSVAFLPLTNGDSPGTLYAQATPSDGSAARTSLAYLEGYGNGTGGLTITGGLIVNGVYSFGQVTSGRAATQGFTLANNNAAGSSAITVKRVTSAPPFLSTTTCGMALAVGQSCSVTVTYTPSNQVAAGTVSPAASADAGSLVIESDAASGPNTINLTGQGAAVGVASPVNSTPLATFTLSQGSLSFAQTAVGDVSTAQTVTLANTGTATIHVSSVFSTADFAIQNGCGTVVAGASCSIAVSAAPQTPGAKIASLEIANDAATSLEFVSLLTTASPSPLTLTPGALNFGPVQVGATATQAVQVTNTGAAPVVFASVLASGDYAAGGTCPAGAGTLVANSSCSVQVTFRPAASGTRTGTLALATSASVNPLTVTLTGVGTQSALTISPSSLAFGSIVVGVAANLALTLTNAGTAPVTNLALSAAGDYAVSIPCPQTLVAGASCTAQVTFTPSAPGARSGTLTVVSSDPSSPDAVPLTGTGIQGGGFTLTVDGGAAASLSVTSGQPATYQLAITPNSGFSGSVALTCTPIDAAEYASCSLLPASIMVAGVQQNSVATINTITSIGGNARLEPALASTLRTAFLCLMLPGLWTLWRGRQSRSRRLLLLAMLSGSFALFAAGCGGGGDPFVRYTPSGTYQYKVTASSTSGIPITQTVVLNLTVTSR
jgi:hypothetical protein